MFKAIQTKVKNIIPKKIKVWMKKLGGRNIIWQGLKSKRKAIWWYYAKITFFFYQICALKVFWVNARRIDISKNFKFFSGPCVITVRRKPIWYYTFRYFFVLCFDLRQFLLNHFISDFLDAKPYNPAYQNSQIRNHRTDRNSHQKNKNKINFFKQHPT